MSKVDIKLIIADWLAEFPKKQMPKGDLDAKVSALAPLYEELIKHGYTLEDLKEKTPAFTEISSSCFNTNYDKVVKRKIWKEMTEKAMLICISQAFKSEIAAQKTITDAEIEERNKQAEIIQKAKDEAKAKRDAEAKAKAEAEANDIKQKVEALALQLPPPPANPLDRSIFKDEPDFEVIYDDNFEEN